MLTAETVENPGVVVWAKDAERGRAYRCPGCFASPLVVKRGEIVVPHFAHPRGVEDCSSEPETLLHLQSKLTIAETFEGVVERVLECPVQVELELGGRRSASVRRRADVFVPKTAEPFVVEVQLSPLTVEELHERTGDYNRAGFPVLWVWGEAVHGRRHGDRAGVLQPSSARRAASTWSSWGARLAWTVDDAGRLWVEETYPVPGAVTLERRAVRYEWRPWETLACAAGAVETVLHDGLHLVARRGTSPRPADAPFLA